MSLPLPLACAADFFSETITVYDVVATKSIGRWVGTPGEDYTISGVIQTKDERGIKFDSDGAISQGTLMLHTRATLSAYDVSQDGQTLTQTFVRYQGDVWRLSRLTNWNVKTQNVNLYYMTKYVNIGDL
jgi:hypothetical protein